MDSPKSSQQSSLDSLRTVEFRQTLRGYHIDDVDEYLERVAVEAEALQEQFRQSNERTRQAAERIVQLEQQLAEQREQSTSTEHDLRQGVGDDTLQRTLLLAQKFVDQTKAEAEAEARAAVSKAEERARILVVDAEAKARAVSEGTERQLREEVGRLESLRTQLAEDVDTIAQHLDDERARLRRALVEMLGWVDKQIQPSTAFLAKRDGDEPKEQEEQEGREELRGHIEERSESEPRQPMRSALANGANAQTPVHDVQRTPTVQPFGGSR
jgi:cell division initiation protein